MTDETYPDTDMLIRFCYSCQKRLDSIDDMWVDYDCNCVVCTQCRDEARRVFAREGDKALLEYDLSVVRVTAADASSINDIEEG